MKDWREKPQVARREREKASIDFVGVGASGQKSKGGTQVDFGIAILARQKLPRKREVQEALKRPGFLLLQESDDLRPKVEFRETLKKASREDNSPEAFLLLPQVAKAALGLL